MLQGVEPLDVGVCRLRVLMGCTGSVCVELRVDGFKRMKHSLHQRVDPDATLTASATGQMHVSVPNLCLIQPSPRGLNDFMFRQTLGYRWP